MIIAHLEARVLVERGTEDTDPATGKLKVPTGAKLERWLKWQPMSGRELEALPEGRRKKRNILIFSRDEFKVGDIIDNIDGDKFEIAVREKHSNHYKSEAFKC